MNTSHRCAFALAVSTVLTATAGAFILPVAEDTSSNARDALTVAAGAGSTLAVNAKQSALIRFNVAGLQGVVAPGAVTAARLRIYFASVIKPGDLELHKVLGNWSESAAGGLPILEPQGFVLPAASVAKKQFAIIDVTEQVKDWLANGGDFGLAFTTQSTTAKVLLGSKEGSATGYPAELEVDVAQSTVNGSTIAAGSVADTQLAGGINVAKLAGGAVSNTEFSFLDGTTGNLQSQLDGKAALNHTHDASQIVSGTLADARLSSNIPRFNAAASFLYPVSVNTVSQTLLALNGTGNGGTWFNLGNSSDATARTYNFIATGLSNSEGSGKLLVRDGSGTGGVRLTLDTSGNFGIGTTNPSAKLEVQADGAKSLKIRQDGVAIGIEGVSNQANDIYAGYLRLRSNVEVWPPVDASKAASLDVRNAAGNATISLAGETGKIAAANLPAVKLAKTVRDPRNGADDLVVNTSATADLDSLSVNVPSDGVLIIRATANANLIAKSGNSGECFYTLYETTSGTPVKLTEMHAQVSREASGGADTFQGGSPSLTWTLPCTAGTRSFKTSLSTGASAAAFVDTTTLLVEYVPNSL